MRIITNFVIATSLAAIACLQNRTKIKISNFEEFSA